MPDFDNLDDLFKPKRTVSIETVSEETAEPNVRTIPMKPARKHSKSFYFIRDTVITLGIAVLVSWLIITFVCRAFYIPSGSMENTLQINDRVLVNELYPNIGSGVHRGDVIVFKDPGGWLTGADKNNGYLIKRVIGLPGDKVSCCNALGQVEINGEGVNETYIKPGNVPSATEFNVTVPAGHVWVMGDNRGNSKDSRYQASSANGSFVPIKDITGQAMLVSWPFSHFKWISGDSGVIFDRK